MSNNHLTTKEFIIGAALGGLLGSLSALLLAPKSGRKIRRDLSDFYEEVADRTQDMACKVVRKSKCVMNNVNQQTSDWTEKAKGLMAELAACVKCYKKEEVEEGHGKDFLIGALAGGVIGALAGLMLAPKPGDDLRDEILESYNDVSNKTQEFADTVQKKGKTFAKTAKKQANRWLDLAKNVVEELVDGAEEFNENVTEKVKDYADTGRERLGQALEWAGLGLRVWKSLNKRK